MNSYCFDSNDPRFTSTSTQLPTENPQLIIALSLKSSHSNGNRTVTEYYSCWSTQFERAKCKHKTISIFHPKYDLSPLFAMRNEFQAGPKVSLIHPHSICSAHSPLLVHSGVVITPKARHNPNIRYNKSATNSSTSVQKG